MSQEDKEFREQILVDAPDDVATLYSWANLHGAKYRDFSASRREHRAQMRANLQAEAARAAAEAASRPQPVATAAPLLGDQPMFASGAVHHEENQAVIYVREHGNPSAHVPHVAPYVPPAMASSAPYQPTPYQAPPVARPAWLYAESPAAPLAAAAPVHEPAHERGTDRWFALKGAFEQAPVREVVHAGGKDARMPVIAVFSLAGGVGKTSLVATLGRALSSFGERSLLVDASSYGLLPYYFGSREARPGVVRTFSPPGGTPDAPIHLLSLEAEPRTGETSQDWVSESIQRSAAGMQRVVIDASTAAGTLARQIMRVATTVLVPIVPDLNSVVSITAVDNFFRQQVSADGRAIQPYYVLSQFDATLPLHMDVREVLKQQLGDRLLPTAVRRSPSVSEGLAEGMTVVDYAPNSPVTEDYLNIAAWLRNVSVPAAAPFRGTRWSER
jgi:cellulose synthase operon protein YhjQ